MSALLPRFNRLICALAAGSVLIHLTGCATAFYARTKTGTFSGKLDVEWIAPNQFIYRPHPTSPLVFTAADGKRYQPREMFTDGGSIPRLFWSSPGYAPWDFAPGYIIHDWLFEQHHCKEGDWQTVTFERSAEILAEAIKTQMEAANKSDSTLVWAVHAAVLTPVAREMWDTGTCKPAPQAARAPGAPSSATAPAAAPVKLKTISF
jgi:hypothetical protein